MKIKKNIAIHKIINTDLKLSRYRNPFGRPKSTGIGDRFAAGVYTTGKLGLSDALNG